MANERDLVSIVERLARSAAFVSALLYILGLLVFQQYMGQIGVSTVTVVATRYLTLGTLLVLFAIGPAAVVMTGVLAGRRRHHFVARMTIGLTAALATLGSLTLIWAVVIDAESLQPAIRVDSAPRWSVPYRVTWGGPDAPIGTAAVTLLLLYMTLYLPALAIARIRRRDTAIASSTMAIAAACITCGFLLSATLFSRTIPYISASFGGAYYGRVKLVFTPTATAAVSIGAANNPDDSRAGGTAGFPVVLLYADEDAVYVRHDLGYDALSYIPPVLRIPQREIVIMERASRIP